MIDSEKTKAALIAELSVLRDKIAALEVVEAKYHTLRAKIRRLGVLIDEQPIVAATMAVDGPPESRATVLVVDDNDVFREFIVNALANYGYKVRAAGNSVEALQVLAELESPVDLIIVDVVMPDVSGRELVRKVTVAYPEVKVLFMSGYTDEILVHSDVQDVIESKVAFLQKPFLTEDLLKMVRRELGEKTANGV